MLTFGPHQIRRIKPDYFDNCRTDVLLYMRTFHPDLVGGLDDETLHRRVTLSMRLASKHGFVTLGAFRWFTFLCFFMSPLFERNRKIRAYFRDAKDGDEALRQVLFAVPPQNWFLLRSRRADIHWERAEHLYRREADL
jgi:hypothetical protein